MPDPYPGPPKPADGGPVPTEVLLAGLRRMPLFRQLAPMESGIGWPVPLRLAPGADDGVPRVCLRVPLFGMRPLRDGGAELFPPFATLTLDRATGRPMEYVDLRLTRPWPLPGDPTPAGTFPHEAVRGTLGDYRAARHELLTLYDALCAGLAARTRFEGRERFSALLRTLLEPGLEPYYRAIGPEFFAHFLGPAEGSGAP